MIVRETNALLDICNAYNFRNAFKIIIVSLPENVQNVFLFPKSWTTFSNEALVCYLNRCKCTKNEMNTQKCVSIEAKKNLKNYMKLNDVSKQKTKNIIEK